MTQLLASIKTRPWRVAVWSVAVISFALQIRFNALSELGYLISTDRVIDDTFYYLLPAWNFQSAGRFTADGETLTYGFQPLWELALLPLASVSPDREVFFRLTLVIAAAFYVATGILLYYLSSCWTRGWKTLIAPVLWLLNPPLIAVFTVGKENALFAFLLVAALLVAYRIHRSGMTNMNILGLGCLLGLLVLARINAVFLVFAFVCILAWGWRKDVARLRGTGLAVLLAVLLVVPWFAYATATFGTPLPSSGSRKLIGSYASVAVFLDQQIPFLNLDTASRFLPASEKELLKRREQFVPFSRYQTWDQFVIPGVGHTLRFVGYVPRISLKFYASLPSLPGRIPEAGVIAVGLLVTAMAIHGFHARMHLSTQSTKIGISRHLPIVAFVAGACLYLSFNAILLPAFLYWGIWYAVPEILLTIVLAACMCALAADSPAWRWLTVFVASRRSKAWVHVPVAAGIMIAASAVVVGFWEELAPRRQADLADIQIATREVVQWADDNLPAGARIGSWDSGAMAWLIDDATVINLDGLANSPDYVNTVYRNWFLFRLGLSDRNLSWDYIRRMKIKFIIQAVYEKQLASNDYFYGVVPPGNYEVIHSARLPYDFGRDDGLLRFVVVRLTY